MIKNLINKIVKKLIQRKLKVSFAESCTGGMLSSTITSVSGSSKVFDLGLITYSNKAKIDILKVSKRIIVKHGAVSQECCLSMVKNLSKISKANISVSITGIAGPNGGTKLKPVGLVFIGIKKGNKIIIKEKLFKSKSRILIQKAAVITSLKIINKII
jgi:nicotinamide-nucleotide amidase|tara:strand:+ start:449 stop:922 length:474 start_codon:yes stop_codon:yes gene_type:complete